MQICARVGGVRVSSPEQTEPVLSFHIDSLPDRPSGPNKAVNESTASPQGPSTQPTPPNSTLALPPSCKAVSWRNGLRERGQPVAAGQRGQLRPCGKHQKRGARFPEKLLSHGTVKSTKRTLSHSLQGAPIQTSKTAAKRRCSQE